MSFLLNPFVFAGADGDFESIATVTSSGTGSTIGFTSIPSTYQHLQIRCLARDSRAAGSGLENVYFTINTDTTDANYYQHQLRGDGASASAGSGNYRLGLQFISNANATANIFAGFVVDILDYANTSKYKTVRTLGGVDLNGSGSVGMFSNLWKNTAAVNAFRLDSWSGTNFASGTTLALYGIKA